MTAEFKAQKVWLDKNDIALCIAAGRRLRVRALRRRYRHKHECSLEGEAALDQHIQGECGAFAASLVYSIPYEERPFSFKGPDLGRCTQVRTLHGEWGHLSFAQYAPRIDLIVRPDDDITHKFILVVGRYPLPPFPSFYVVGHIEGRAAKVPRFWGSLNNNRPDVWKVPQSELTPAPAWPF